MTEPAGPMTESPEPLSDADVARARKLHALRTALLEYPLSLRELAALAVDVALFRSDGNVSQAARALCIGRSSLHRRIKRLSRTSNDATKEGEKP